MLILLSLCVLFCSVYSKVFIVNIVRIFSNNGIQNYPLNFIFQIDRERKSYLNNKYVECQSQNVKIKIAGVLLFLSNFIRDLTVFTVNKMWNKNEHNFIRKKYWSYRYIVNIVANSWSYMFDLQFHWFNCVIIITIITIVNYFLVCVVKNCATFVKGVKQIQCLCLYFS